MEGFKHKLSFEGGIARVYYFGKVVNQDIKDAHRDLRDRTEFYDSNSLIINLMDCCLEKVEVPGLVHVIAADLGASFSVKKLKVAFILQSNINMERTSEYINKSFMLLTPWEWRHFLTEEAALEWFAES